MSLPHEILRIEVVISRDVCASEHDNTITLFGADALLALQILVGRQDGQREECDRLEVLLNWGVFGPGIANVRALKRFNWYARNVTIARRDETERAS